MRENSRKLRFETSMLPISRGHVLAKVSHVGRITLRDMSALRVIFYQNEFWVFGCRLGPIVRVFFFRSSRKLSLFGEFPGENKVDGLPPAHRR